MSKARDWWFLAVGPHGEPNRPNKWFFRGRPGPKIRCFDARKDINIPTPNIHMPRELHARDTACDAAEMPQKRALHLLAHRRCRHEPWACGQARRTRTHSRTCQSRGTATRLRSVRHLSFTLGARTQPRLQLCPSPKRSALPPLNTSMYHHRTLTHPRPAQVELQDPDGSGRAMRRTAANGLALTAVV